LPRNEEAPFPQALRTLFRSLLRKKHAAQPARANYPGKHAELSHETRFLNLNSMRYDNTSTQPCVESHNHIVVVVYRIPPILTSLAPRPPGAVRPGLGRPTAVKLRLALREAVRAPMIRLPIPSRCGAACATRVSARQKSRVRMGWVGRLAETEGFEPHRPRFAGPFWARGAALARRRAPKSRVLIGRMQRLAETEGFEPSIRLWSV
jgi:hypothetical protein